MEPLRVALCEDVPKDRQTLLTLLQSIPIRTECVVFSSGEALLEVYLSLIHISEPTRP